MSAKTLAEPVHRRPNVQAMGASHVEFDLGTEPELLHQEPEWQTGHNSKTLVKYESLRIVLIAMKAGIRIPEHQTEGRISIQTIRGRIVVRATGRTFDLSTGGLLALDQGLRHDVEALEDSAFLLSIAWPWRNAK
jgi:quercetin dioxygenase-like cupin family protein